ncbi:MAG: ferritin family protein [Candidatus Omnitrophota bacterium]
MDYQEALNMALSTEKAAIEMYRKYSVKYPAIKDLFGFLMNEEEKHAVMIEKKIAELCK